MDRGVTLKSLVLLILVLLCTGCAQVQPWEKAYLAKPEMQFAGNGGIDRIKGHVRFSKEAAHGDTTLSSGGCGCN